MTIEEFSKEWVAIWNQMREEKSSRTKIGKKFEKYFKDSVLCSFVPPSFKIAEQRGIEGIDYKFDFLFVESDAPYRKVIEPSRTMAVFEVKSHGFFEYAAVEKIASILQDIKRRYPKIVIFYVAFRETDTYDRKVRKEFGDLASSYYRLSDSGDGIQMPPPKLFSNEWNRLMESLSFLK
jgi:hypothetical protein